MTTNFIHEEMILNSTKLPQNKRLQVSEQLKRLFTTDKDKAELMKQALANRLRQTTAVKK